jgi:Asp-tRNA(Asn)/Glu-tRNA(Gln) amidotransferase A subunit family amidase
METFPARFTLIETAKGIRTGQFTAESLAIEVLERFQQFQHLGTLIRQDSEHFLEAARDADRVQSSGRTVGPLHGVPILVKDNIDVRGLPCSAGTPALEHDYPRNNALVVQRMLDAGALIAGKANLYELAVGGTSLNRHFGRVSNPWNPDLIPGGSSSGSAAAVAAHLVPASLGTDTNGSVRGPCSLSGIAGYRPSFGRYPGHGIIPHTPTRDSVGSMANSVADLALLDAVLGNDAYTLKEIDLDGIRLGRPRGDFYAVMDDRTASVIDSAVAILERQGAVIVDADIPDLAAMTAKCAWTISGYEVPSELPDILANRGTSLSIADIVAGIASPVVRDRFNPLAVNLDILEPQYRLAMDRYRPQLQNQLNAYFAENDLAAFVFPTTPFPAPAIDEDNADLEINGRLVKGGFAHVINNTVYQSAAGIPSLTVPAGLTTDGLPVGLSFDGPPGSDQMLLAIGSAFEAARGDLPAPSHSA